MKFYDCATAPSPRRARIFIAEKGLDIPTVQIDLAGGEHLQDAFRSINPRCTVPALETDDHLVLCDNAAIMAFLEALYPDPPLLGSNPTEKGQVADWTARVEQEGLSAVAETLRNSVPGMAGRATTGPENYAQIPELAERGRKRAAHFYRMLDDRLSEAPYLAGLNFTAADINALVTVDFADRVKLRPDEDLQHLEAWHARVRARPSAKA